MIRTTPELVAGIIELDVKIDLTPFIAGASALVDELSTLTIQTADRLQLIETWLTAHFYTIRDPRVVHEKAGSVMAAYQTKVDVGLSTSHYGQMAMILDTSGVLRRLSKGKVRPGVAWLGTASPNDPP